MVKSLLRVSSGIRRFGASRSVVARQQGSGIAILDPDQHQEGWTDDLDPFGILLS